MKRDKEINYCNEKGDVCIARFSFKEKIDNRSFEEFLSKLYDEKLGLVNSNVLGFEINSLILWFKNFEFEKLKMIYDESKVQEDGNVMRIILEYLDSFTCFDYKVFCSAKECEAVIGTVKLPIFKNRESIVLNKVINSKKVDIIDDLVKYQKKDFIKIG